MSILRKLVDWWFNRTCGNCTYYRVFTFWHGTVGYHCTCPKIRVGNTFEPPEGDEVWVDITPVDSCDGAIQPGCEFGCIHYRNMK